MIEIFFFALLVFGLAMIGMAIGVLAGRHGRLRRCNGAIRTQGKSKMIATKTVRDFMAERLVSIYSDMDIHEAVKLLIREHISSVPIVDKAGALVGVLSEKDCFKVSFCCGYYQDRGGQVSDYMTRSVITVNADADIVGVAEMFLKGPYRRFPVVSGERVVGVINRRDALRALLELW